MTHGDLPALAAGVVFLSAAGLAGASFQLLDRTYDRHVTVAGTYRAILLIFALGLALRGFTYLFPGSAVRPHGWMPLVFGLSCLIGMGGLLDFVQRHRSPPPWSEGLSQIVVALAIKAGLPAKQQIALALAVPPAPSPSITRHSCCRSLRVAVLAGAVLALIGVVGFLVLASPASGLAG